MMVVEVLMTSCQVSLKPKIGPVTAHATTIANAIRNVAGRPAACAIPPGEAFEITLGAICRDLPAAAAREMFSTGPCGDGCGPCLA